jgi:hypothetical protein
MGRSDLQPFVSTPNGGAARRCQAMRRDGGQCGAPARRGYSVCVRHGAGLPSREREQALDRRPRGRPIVHGLYSRAGRRKIAEVVAELEAAQIDLDNSDSEMRVLRGTLSFLLGQADVHEKAEDVVGGVFAVLERTLSHQTLDPAEARVIANAMTAADRLLGRTESWVRAVLDAARFLVKASRERADTRAKVAEARALETLTRYIHVLRGILHDSVSEEQLDIIEGRLVREIFAPNGLELPDRDEPLVD